jgi:hypothetical protein
MVIEKPVVGFIVADMLQFDDGAPFNVLGKANPPNRSRSPQP